MTFFDDLRHDVRYAARTLSRNPGFSLVAIISISLRLRVTSTLFSLFNAVALKPLPVAEPDQVVRVKRWFETGSQGDVQYSFSYPEFMHIRDGNETFASVVASSSINPVMAIIKDASAG